METKKKYDVFISSKSEDYPIAEKVYDFLVANGLSVFLASRELNHIGEAEYSEAVDSAIDATHHMIVVTTSIDNIKSKWVKHEWTTFANELRSNYKEGNLLTILGSNVPLKDLPITLRHKQSFSVKSYKENILDYLYKDKRFDDTAKAEQERLRKEKELQEKIAQAEAAKKELEEKARMAEEKARKAEEERRVAEEKARKAEEERHLVEEEEEEKLHAKETADPAKHTIEEEYQRHQQRKDEHAKTKSSGFDLFTTIFIRIYTVVKLGLIVAVCWSPFALYGRFASNKFAERGHEYFYGTNEVQQDYAEAVKKYKHAVKGSKFTNPNYGLASYNLALCYEKGLGVEVNNEEAFERYRKSARRHNIAAMYKVADCYANGELDVEKDSVKAIKWYKKASAENLEFSRNELSKTAIVRAVKEKHHEIMILPTKVKKCTVTTIGNYAFSKSSIKSIEIPEGVTTIENYAFAQCDSLVEIVLPTSIVSIEENAFQGSTSLSKILIPSGTRNKFASMAGLKDMEDKLVETPTDIKQKQFVQDSIRQVDTQDGIAKQSKTDTNLITFNETKTTTKEPRQSIRERKPSNNVEEKLSQQMNQSKSPIKADSTYNKKIPNVTFDKKELQKVLEKFPTNLIADGLMYQKNATYMGLQVIGLIIGADRSNFITATIPHHITYNGMSLPVTSIGNQAFNGCYALTSIKIPNSVTHIGEFAFGSCVSLTSISIPKQVTSIGDGAFLDCSSLTSITLPNSVTNIGTEVFSGCNSLTSMVVQDGNSTYNSKDNCNAIIETATNTLIAGCQNTIIPNGVVAIGEFAFSNIDALTSIFIPKSVCLIDFCAFTHCESLKSVTIDNNKFMRIGLCAFTKCPSLTSIHYNGTKQEWKSITRHSEWKKEIPATVVHCTNGNVKI